MASLRSRPPAKGRLSSGWQSSNKRHKASRSLDSGIRGREVDASRQVRQAEVL